MTPPTPMTREELIELAALDAYGLLDEYETALFTRSFHHAPSAVQDEIKELQAAYASEARLLPEVAPRPDLGQKVGEAVARAIEAETIEFAPIATIGRNRARAEESSVSSLRERAPFASYFWRAAVFVLTGALIVVSFFGLQLKQDVNRLSGYAYGKQSEEQIRQLLGPPFATEYLLPGNTRIVLAPTTDSSMLADLAVLEENQSVRLLTIGLPTKSEYYLVVRDTQGNEVRRFSFEQQFHMTGARLGSLGELVVSTLSFEVTDLSGVVLLSSNRT